MVNVQRIVLVVPMFARALFGVDVYFNDFNGSPGTTFTEWTSSGYKNSANSAGTVAAGGGPQAVATVVSPNGKQRFLGEFGGPAIVTAPPYDGQHFVRVNETVTLTLHNLQPHTLATVSFDLYVLKSWDGNNPHYGPDRWSLSVGGGPKLLDTTVSNNPKTDAYDLSTQNYPIANSAYQTGAAAVNTLGYTFFGDSIYHLTFTFAHASETVVLNFPSSMFEGKGTVDESWGLDNVRVSINSDVPVAVSTAAPGAGLAPGALASIYGVNLASTTAAAGYQPWPATLAGVTVTLHDTTGADLIAPLLYVSPGQINLQVPQRTAVDPVTFTVQTALTLPGFPANVQAAAPAIFTANGDGRGVAAATAVRIPTGSLVPLLVPVFQCGDATGSCTSVPIELAVDTPLYLVLFCTGVRNTAPDSVSLLIAGQSVPVLDVAQPIEQGVDQIVIALPSSLTGSGEVDVVVRVNDTLSNTAKINVR